VSIVKKLKDEDKITDEQILFMMKTTDGGRNVDVSKKLLVVNLI